VTIAVVLLTCAALLVLAIAVSGAGPI